MAGKKKVLVTGASGLLGYAVRRVAPTFPGFEIVFTDRGDVDLEIKDSAQALLQRIRPDAVLHLAAVVAGIQFNIEHPEEMRDRNRRINDNLLQNAFKLKIPKVVSILSTCIFPDNAPEPWTEGIIHSGEPDRHQWGYAQAKRELDLLSKDLTKRSAGTSLFTTLMPSTLYGPNDNYNPEKSHVMSAAVLKIYQAKRTSTPAVFWGSGAPRREFLLSLDMARVLLRAIDHYHDAETMIVAPPRDHSVHEITQAVAAHMDYSGEIVWDSAQKDGRLSRKTDQGKFKRWWPEFEVTPLNVGLDMMIRDFESHYPRLRGL